MKEKEEIYRLIDDPTQISLTKKSSSKDLTVLHVNEYLEQELRAQTVDAPIEIALLAETTTKTETDREQNKYGFLIDEVHKAISFKEAMFERKLASAE